MNDAMLRGGGRPSHETSRATVVKNYMIRVIRPYLDKIHDSCYILDGGIIDR